MPARVHHIDFVSGVVGRADAACVSQAGLFLHRQRIEFGPHQDGRAAAVAQHSDDAVAAEARRDVKAGPLEFLRHALARLFFVQ